MSERLTCTVRPKACEACPYRRDVPSGVWSKEEYDKLRDYDLPLPLQPTAIFCCHAAPGAMCHGWAITHNSLAFILQCHRIGRPIKLPEPSTPLFNTGNEAADHGEKDIKRPKSAARRMMALLLGKHKRLRDGLQERIEKRTKKLRK